MCADFIYYLKGKLGLLVLLQVGDEIDKILTKAGSDSACFIFSELRKIN